MKYWSVILLFGVLFNSQVYSQDYETQIKKLETTKKKLQDSIQNIDLEILRLQSESFIDETTGNILILSVRQGGKLKSDNHYASDAIMIFEDGDKIVADISFYKEGYIKACFNNTCG